MLRQIMKLERARKAYKDGRFQEALALTEDPDIREHVKAQRLRTECLDALGQRALKHEERGELSLATADAKLVTERAPEGDAAELERRIEMRKRVREEAEQRLRQVYYKARLDVERGDPAAALESLKSIDESTQTTEIRTLRRELEVRLAEARRLLEEARVGSESVDARNLDDLLRRAAALDPKSKQLEDCAAAIAKKRAETAARADLSDGALAAFLPEHGAFKRRWLEGRVSTEGLDRVLADNCFRRIEKLLSDGKCESAQTILDRALGALDHDERLESLHRGLGALRRGTDHAERGHFAVAREMLESARDGLPSKRPFKDAVSAMEKSERASRALVDAVKLLDRGRPGEAQKLLVEMLAEAPRHEAAHRLLRVINTKLADDEDKLVQVRRHLSAGQPIQAQEVLFVLRAGRSDLEDVSVLSEEIESQIEEQVRHEIASPSRVAASVKLGAHERSTSTSASGPVASRWILAVEERGEYLVVEDDEVVIGNAAKGLSSLGVLANIGSRHAVIMRKTSFHGGMSYIITALEDRPVLVGRQRVDSRELRDGDQVQLGPDFSFTFRLPSSRSKAALLELPHPFVVEGVSRVLLMPRAGRLAGLIIGPDGAHVKTGDLEGECEIHREKDSGELVVQSSCGVSVDGAEPVAKARLDFGMTARAQEVVVSVRNAG